MQFKPKISVIVCTYNRSNLLKTCLNSLVNQSLDISHFEIIIVDNNSRDNTYNVVKQYMKEHANIQYVKENKQGLSYARNRGYIESNGEYVAYIDDDAKADVNWIKNILLAFETIKPKPAVVGGPILPYYISKKPNWWKDEYETSSWGKKSKFLKGIKAKEGFYGSNMTFLKNLLIKYNGFKANYGMSGKKMSVGEETELFQRMFNDGIKLWYDPSIKIKHFTPPKNMTLTYRFKRIYLRGYFYSKLQKENGKYFGFSNILKIIIDICKYSIILVIKVPFRLNKFKFELYDKLSPIASSIGKLFGILGI